jgi:hypothetical protein
VRNKFLTLQKRCLSGDFYALGVILPSQAISIGSASEMGEAKESPLSSALIH